MTCINHIKYIMKFKVDWSLLKKKKENQYFFIYVRKYQAASFFLVHSSFNFRSYIYTDGWTNTCIILLADL